MFSYNFFSVKYDWYFFVRFTQKWQIIASLWYKNTLIKINRGIIIIIIRRVLWGESGRIKFTVKKILSLITDNTEKNQLNQFGESNHLGKSLHF